MRKYNDIEKHIIGNRIKDRRLELGMSQAELAKRIGAKHQTTISKIEVEKRGVPLKYLKPLAEALQTTQEYLLGEIVSPDYYAFRTINFDKSLEVFSELSAPNQKSALDYMHYLYKMQTGHEYEKKE